LGTTIGEEGIDGDTTPEEEKQRCSFFLRKVDMFGLGGTIS